MAESGRMAEAAEQFELSVGQEPLFKTSQNLVVAYQLIGDEANFIRSCERLFSFEGVQRPFGTVPVPGTRTNASERYKRACIQTARQVTPETLRKHDPTGGAWQDSDGLNLPAYD